eukprot:m.36698 g.36698  ORF g.36698 m.36698 type:complete len:183 (+) comp10030_c0_seq1:401-949(+)
MYASRVALRTLKAVQATSLGRASVLRTQAPVVATRFFSQTTATREEASADKTYSPKVESLVADISSMTLLEVADLVDALKTRLNISDMPVAAAVAAAPAAGEAPAEAVEEQTEFEIKLVGFDASSKIKIIKEVRSILPDLKLAEAKKLVEDLPHSLKQGITKEEAEEIKAKLEGLGGKLEIV